MSTFEMLKKAIIARENRGTLTQEYIADTKEKMDVFLLNDRITQEEYTQLVRMLEE